MVIEDKNTATFCRTDRTDRTDRTLKFLEVMVLLEVVQKAVPTELLGQLKKMLYQEQHWIARYEV